MLLKLGALLVSQEKPYMSTADEVPERFPVKIAFTRKLDEQELTKLAIYALMVERGRTIVLPELRRENGRRTEG